MTYLLTQPRVTLQHSKILPLAVTEAFPLHGTGARIYTVMEVIF